jgi:hypothetical protein
MHDSGEHNCTIDERLAIWCSQFCTPDAGTEKNAANGIRTIRDAKARLITVDQLVVELLSDDTQSDDPNSQIAPARFPPQVF